MTTTETAEHLTPNEVAAAYPIATKTLAHMRSRGDGPEFRKFGRRVLYSRVNIEKWIDECTANDRVAQRREAV